MSDLSLLEQTNLEQGPNNLFFSFSKSKFGIN